MIFSIQVPHLLSLFQRGFFFPVNTIVNAGVFLISISCCSFLLCEMTIDLFCVDFVSCKFTKFFIPDTVSSVQSSAFAIYKILSSIIKDNFTSSFPIWMTFSFFSFSFCLIALARTSSTVWNENWRSEHP